MRVTREIVREIVESKSQEPPVILENPRGKSLENRFPSEIERIAAPSKMQLAIEWLKAHPEDMNMTGRDLKQQRKPAGVEISHKTWNDAKKQIADGE